MPDPYKDPNLDPRLMRVADDPRGLHVPIEALRDPGLSLAAKGLLAEMGCVDETIFHDAPEGGERDLATQELIERGYLVEVEPDDD